MPGWADGLPTFEAGTKLATRRAINQCLNATAAGLPGLLAGSADLTGNNGVALKGADLQAAATPGGAQLHYGIREHAMGATMTGMALHGGVLPVGGTFFIFSDYMRPAVRLAALSGAHVIYSWTHDSIGVGEDGPTHEPVEHLASLRAMPQMTVVRPADANETAQAWRLAVEADGPIGLALTRQSVPVLDATAERAPAGVAKGGYILVDESGPGPAQLVLIGTGSEVQHCVGAAKELEESGVSARVVSLPCWEWFEQQGEEYRGRDPAARRPDAERRGGGDLRVESLRRRVRRPRPFRGLGPGRGQHGEVRFHRRPCGRAGPGPAGHPVVATRSPHPGTRRTQEKEQDA